MATEMRRFMVSIPKELDKKLRSVKQAKFFGDSWSEMCRNLLDKGANQYLKDSDKQDA